MDSQQQQQREPGITINTICLVKADIQVRGRKPPENCTPLEYRLALTGLRRFEHNDGQHLIVRVCFDAMHGVSDPAFTFTCEFVASYERAKEASMPWSEFTDGFAVAHIVPYLREFVSNMTNRMPVPVLYLPPVNAFAMVADYERRKAAPPSPVAPPPA